MKIKEEKLVDERIKKCKDTIYAIHNYCFLREKLHKYFRVDHLRKFSGLPYSTQNAGRHIMPYLVEANVVSVHSIRSHRTTYKINYKKSQLNDILHEVTKKAEICLEPGVTN